MLINPSNFDNKFLLNTPNIGVNGSFANFGGFSSKNYSSDFILSSNSAPSLSFTSGFSPSLGFTPDFRLNSGYTGLKSSSSSEPMNLDEFRKREEERKLEEEKTKKEANERNKLQKLEKSLPELCKKIALGGVETANHVVASFGTAASSAATFVAFENAGKALSAKRTIEGAKRAQEMIQKAGINSTEVTSEVIEEGRKALVDSTKSLRKIERKYMKKPSRLKQKFMKDPEARISLLREKGSDKFIAIKDQERKVLEAMQGSDVGKIAEENEKLRTLTSRRFIRNKKLSAQEAIDGLSKPNWRGKTSMEKVVNKAVKFSTKTPVGKVASKSLKTFKGFAIFDGVIEGITKIIPAFSKGGFNVGMTQLGQSALRITATSGSYALGHAAGAWAGAKLGAAIGVAGGPWGAAIGAVLGIAVGCVASMFAEKGMNKLMPVEANDKLVAEQKALSGDVMVYVQIIEDKVQKGEYVDSEALKACEDLKLLLTLREKYAPPASQAAQPSEAPIT